ncbi:MAG: hypothetical protein ACXWMV_04830, partial [Syntrophales bacterium]
LPSYMYISIHSRKPCDDICTVFVAKFKSLFHRLNPSTAVWQAHTPKHGMCIPIETDSAYNHRMTVLPFKRVILRAVVADVRVSL